jgi:hypothetical protein
MWVVCKQKFYGIGTPFQTNIILKLTSQLEKYQAISISFFFLTFDHAWD